MVIWNDFGQSLASFEGVRSLGIRSEYIRPFDFRDALVLAEFGCPVLVVGENQHFTQRLFDDFLENLRGSETRRRMSIVFNVSRLEIHEKRSGCPAACGGEE